MHCKLQNDYLPNLPNLRICVDNQISFIAPFRSAVRGKVVEKEHDTHFEPFKFRYRRAAGPIDENKVSCTLKMNVSQLIEKLKDFFI